MSDDHRSWSAGVKDMDEIKAGAKLVPNGEAIKEHFILAWNLANYGHE